MDKPLLIFSDSDALIGDIQYVFKNRLECVSSDSLDWVERYLKGHDVKLLIADLDMEIAFQTEVLKSLREYRDEGLAFLFLVSERRKFELERDADNASEMAAADWLVKPFSRDSLIDSVYRLCS